jgi:hypothetical protein
VVTGRSLRHKSAVGGEVIASVVGYSAVLCAARGDGLRRAVGCVSVVSDEQRARRQGLANFGRVRYRDLQKVDLTGRGPNSHDPSCPRETAAMSMASTCARPDDPAAERDRWIDRSPRI